MLLPKKAPHSFRFVFIGLANLCVLLALAGCDRPSGSTAPQSSAPDPAHPLQTADPSASSGTAQSGAAADVRPVEGQNLEYGVLVDFTVGGNADPLKVSGWSKPESGFTWSSGSAATIAARVKPTDSPMVLRTKAAGMIKEPELPFQPVEVYMNNDKVADLQIGDTAEFMIPIPQGFTKAGGLLTITFRTPKAVSPKALGSSEDERVLGIRIFNLEIGPAT